MRAGDGFDLSLGFFWKAETKINEDDVASDWNQVISDSSKDSRQCALNGPGQFARQPKYAEPKPHGPMLRKPETGLFAGAAHAQITLPMRCGRAADSTPDRCTS